MKIKELKNVKDGKQKKKHNNVRRLDCHPHFSFIIDSAKEEELRKLAEERKQREDEEYKLWKGNIIVNSLTLLGSTQTV